ncbi:hypothetical protein BDAP_000699 [Binucleata daphniae]
MDKQTIDILKLIESNNTNNTETVEFKKSFHSQVKKKKKVDAVTFQKIKKMVNTKEFDDFIDNNDFTKNESVVIGRAMMKSKIKDKQKYVDIFTKHKNIVVLQCLLCTKMKVDVSNVVVLVKSNLENPNCELLRLLLVLWRNYKSYIDEEIITFCKNNKHGICVEIYSEYEKL